MRWIIAIVVFFQMFGCSKYIHDKEKTTDPPKYPWSAIAPEPYSIADKSLFTKVYKEQYDKSIDKDELNRFIKRAKEVVLQWGGNPDELIIDESTHKNVPEIPIGNYKYVPEVQVSENFVHVIFRPSFTFLSKYEAIFGYELSVILRRNNEEVIEIVFGD